MHDWVVWCVSQKRVEEIRSFELSGKEIFSNYDETKSKEETREQKEREPKEGTSRAERTIQVTVEARQHQNGSKRESRFTLGSERLTVTTKQIQALLTAVRASGGKDERQVRLTGIEWEYWMGTEIGRSGGYGF